MAKRNIVKLIDGVDVPERDDLTLGELQELRDMAGTTATTQGDLIFNITVNAYKLGYAVGKNTRHHEI